jgi:hypothetical protein
MHWISVIGTIVIGAVLLISLLAMFDILFRTPDSSRARNRDRHIKSRTQINCPAGTDRLTVRRREWRPFSKKD